jgi:hypothetical protein
MKGRSIRTRLNDLDKRSGPRGARPCPVCGVLLDRRGNIVGPVRWVVKPPKAFENLGEHRPVTPPPRHCRGCGRLCVVAISSPLGPFAYLDSEPGEPLPLPKTIPDPPAPSPH